VLRTVTSLDQRTGFSARAGRHHFLGGSCHDWAVTSPFR